MTNDPFSFKRFSNKTKSPTATRFLACVFSFLSNPFNTQLIVSPCQSTMTPCGIIDNTRPSSQLCLLILASLSFSTLFKYFS